METYPLTLSKMHGCTDWILSSTEISSPSVKGLETEWEDIEKIVEER